STSDCTRVLVTLGPEAPMHCPYIVRISTRFFRLASRGPDAGSQSVDGVARLITVPGECPVLKAARAIGSAEARFIWFRFWAAPVAVCSSPTPRRALWDSCKPDHSFMVRSAKLKPITPVVRNFTSAALEVIALRFLNSNLKVTVNSFFILSHRRG